MDLDCEFKNLLMKNSVLRQVEQETSIAFKEGKRELSESQVSNSIRKMEN